MPKSFQLIVTPPSGEPTSHRLTADRVSLGRAEENRIRLEVKAISSRHCEFRVGNGGYELIDLGSTNGTKINGVALNGHAVPLKNGDQILLAESVTAHFFAAVEAVPGGETAARAPAPAPTPKARAAAIAESDREWVDWVPINPVAAAVAQQQGTFDRLLEGID